MPSYRAKAIEAWDYFLEAKDEAEAKAILEDEAYKYRNEFAGATIVFIEEVKDEQLSE
jgi:hypothetical protein